MNQIEKNTIDISFVGKEARFQLEVGGSDNILVSPAGNIQIEFPVPGSKRDLTFRLESTDISFRGFFAARVGSVITSETRPILHGPVPDTPFFVEETTDQTMTIRDTYGKDAIFSYALFVQLPNGEFAFVDPEIKNEGGMIHSHTLDTTHPIACAQLALA